MVPLFPNSGLELRTWLIVEYILTSRQLLLTREEVLNISEDCILHWNDTFCAAKKFLLWSFLCIYYWQFSSIWQFPVRLLGLGLTQPPPEDSRIFKILLYSTVYCTISIGSPGHGHRPPLGGRNLDMSQVTETHLAKYFL